MCQVDSVLFLHKKTQLTNESKARKNKSLSNVAILMLIVSAWFCLPSMDSSCHKSCTKELIECFCKILPTDPE